MLHILDHVYKARHIYEQEAMERVRNYHFFHDLSCVQLYLSTLNHAFT